MQGLPSIGQRTDGESEQLTGIVSDIQRFSIHDGPGIRTTVFLKGCTQRCYWCHNPETLRTRPEIQFLRDKCIGCGECVRVCPRGAHTLAGGVHVFSRNTCVGCGTCASYCYTDALVLIGDKMTVEEVVDEVLRDRSYYEDSGGGLTLSGGEPLMQWEFSREILRRCRSQDIHTVIETAGNYSWDRLQAVLPYVDMVMMDIKHIDSGKHREGTGVENHRILANARRLARIVALPLLFRTPVIPAFNDVPDDIRAIAAFVRELVGLRAAVDSEEDVASISYQLLAFHPMGADKYRGLDMDNRTEGLRSPSKKRMIELAGVARALGISVKI